MASVCQFPLMSMGDTRTAKRVMEGKTRVEIRNEYVKWLETRESVYLAEDHVPSLDRYLASHASAAFRLAS